MADWLTDRMKIGMGASYFEPQVVRTPAELGATYGTYYQTTCVELNAEIPLHDFDSTHLWKSHVVVGPSYCHVSGSNENNGSSSDKFLFHGAFRQNFIRFAFVEVGAVLGVSNDEMDFGKGFPPMTGTPLNIAVKARGGAELCLEGIGCLRGGAELLYLDALGGETAHLLYGIGGFVSVSMADFIYLRSSDSPTCEEILADRVMDASTCRNLLTIKEKDIEHLHKSASDLARRNNEISDFLEDSIVRTQALCPDMTLSLPQYNKSVPNLDFSPDWIQYIGSCSEKLEEAKKYAERCSEDSPVMAEYNKLYKEFYSTQNSASNANNALLDSAIQFVGDSLKCVSQIENQKTLFQVPAFVHFGNDNPDLRLHPQWFVKDEGALHGCFSEPLLDHYIRTLYKWAGEERRKPASEKLYQIEIWVHGYANETGDESRNKSLGKAREKSVVDYMRTNGPIESLLNLIDGVSLKQRKRQLKSAGIDFEKLSQYKSCGALDESGSHTITLDNPIFQDLVEIKAATNGSGANMKSRIYRDFGSKVNVEDPKYRVARLEVVVKRKDGLKVSGEEDKRIQDELQLWGDRLQGE